MNVHTTILCPIDFSEPSTIGLDVAVLMAERIDAEILLVHVIPPVPVAALPQASPAFDIGAYEKELTKSAKSRLKELAEKNIQSDIKVRSVVVTGDPAQEIDHIGANEDVSMIVMASHGESGWRRLVFGSVTEKVIRSACCLVLIVPEPDEDDSSWVTFVRRAGKKTEGSEL
jgi:universal stress protein A